MNAPAGAPFPPEPAAFEARLAAVDPARYAATRNHLDGAVTRLSPYLTHGYATVGEVLARLRARHALHPQHKLVQELAWREFFQHAWRHDGEAIFASLHAGPLPDAAYARELPADVRAGATGVPVVDQAVRALYATGWLHNHARLWLASYLVHLRKVRWRAGADWMYGHLLDGDLGSNHLSWQWVAGTGSHKPYLFNADNVARYAPASWHSPGTAVDAGYDALAALAADPRPVAAERQAPAPVPEPPLRNAPPEPLACPPDPAAVAGADVWLVHPWSLAAPPPGRLPVAVLEAGFHERWPWSAQRWAFVAARMAAIAPVRWYGPAAAIHAALAAARSVGGVHNTHLGPACAGLALAPMPQAFPEPPRRCRSFSAYWSRIAG